MPNSTITLSTITTYAKSFPEIAGVVQQGVGGSSIALPLQIANDVMIEMLSPAYNWKYNSFLLPLFATNSWQQDYALNVVNLGWLESGWLIDINNAAQPQPVWPLEVVKDLPPTSTQYGQPGQVCWFNNDQLVYATWGAPNPGAGTPSGTSNFPNPQPNSPISTLYGVPAGPANPLLQVKDAFGNLWVVTTFGITGATNPFATNQNPQNLYPTPANPTQSAQTVLDGSVVWTAVNPKGQGVRCNPLPPQTGTVFQFNLKGQWRPFAFSNGPFSALSQTIEPIPDDFSKYFKDGFIAKAYRHATEKAIRGKAQDMEAFWMKSMMDAKVQGDRERDNMGFYPATPILDQPGLVYPGPAWPFQFPWA
jgi:hypothetical protein